MAQLISCNGCQQLLSEDLQHRARIGGVRTVDRFKAASAAFVAVPRTGAES